MKQFSERDIDCLNAILDHCDRIEKLKERFGDSFEIFAKDPAYIDAALMNIFQIGELSNQLSDECREIFSETPWHQIYGTRNIIAHAYVKVDNMIIWNIISYDIPRLKKEINKKTGIL